MTDLSMTIDPKSDQLNADNLIAGPMTITITKVGQGSTQEQPIKIFFEGDNGKPYIPCKSMRRVLVQVWGKDGAAYVGRSMTLFRDPSVMFGGVAVGGIRISHMSDIEKEVSMALTASKTSRKMYTVHPLRQQATQAPAQKKSSGTPKTIEQRVEDVLIAIVGADTEARFLKVQSNASGLITELEDAGRGLLLDKVTHAFDERRRELGVKE